MEKTIFDSYPGLRLWLPESNKKLRPGLKYHRPVGPQEDLGVHKLGKIVKKRAQVSADWVPAFGISSVNGEEAMERNT